MSDAILNNERTRFKISLEIAFLFTLLIWLTKFLEIIEGTSFYRLGIQPRSFTGLTGIVTAPLIHSDFNHLINNTITIFILLVGLVYFYRDLWYKILLLSWLVSGTMVWVAARTSYHIGCSGLIYAIASFIFFSGVIRKNINLMAISLLVVFLYGGLIWGVLPVFHKISWEYHLFGGITGAILAFVYRRQGPPPQTWSWMSETAEDIDETLEYWESKIFDENDKEKL